MSIVALTCLAMDVYGQHNVACVGGNAVNVASQCRYLGEKKVSVIGAVGRDPYGEALITHLRAEGIHAGAVHVYDADTAVHEMVLTDGERSESADFWHGGVFETFRLCEHDWKTIAQHDIVAIGAFDPNFEETMSRLLPSQKRVVDFLDTRDFAYLNKHLSGIDIAMMSANEDDIGTARALSADSDTVIIITLGAKGSAVLSHGEILFRPALSVEKVVDTTGCGDAFQAGFFVSWFAEGDLHTAMMSGAMSAALTASHLGGTRSPSSPIWKG